MKVLFLTISWPEAEQSNLYTDLVDKFIDEGNKVTVVCSRQNRTGKATVFEMGQGLSVLRVKTGNISKVSLVEKVLSLLYLNFQFNHAINKHLKEKSFDLILFNTPPITLTPLLKKLKKRYNSFFYLMLKDIWPYGFLDFKLISKSHIGYKILRMHEKSLYILSDKIGCMSPRGVSFIIKNNPDIDQNKIEVCPNAIKSQMIKYSKNKDKNNIARIKLKYGIPDEATIFMYSGNVGLGHGVGFFIDTIIALKNYQKAFFFFGGAGTHFTKAIEKLERHCLNNVYWYNYLPQDEFEDLLLISQVGVILLDSKYTYPQFPSRLLSYLANSMAVLCSVNEETDIGEIVEGHSAGINTLHGDRQAFQDAIKTMSENTNLTLSMQQNAHQMLKDKYDVDYAYQTIINSYKTYSKEND